MLTARSSLRILLYTAALASIGLFTGCAYFINGSYQNVPILVPPGTVVFDTSNEQIPIGREVLAGDTISYLRLDRYNNNYALRLNYKSFERRLVLESSFDPQWLGLDIIFTPIILVDIATHSFSHFAGFALRASSDTEQSFKDSRFDLYEPDRLFSRPIGLILRAGFEHSGFISNNTGSFLIVIPNAFELGVGYALSDRLFLMGTWGFSSGIDPLPTGSSYSSINPEAFSLQFEGHFSFYHGLFLELGAGESNFTADRISASDPQRSQFHSWSEQVPTGDLAIGYGGRMAYLQLRYLSSLRTLRFPNGESSRFQSLGFGFGFNLHL